MEARILGLAPFRRFFPTVRPINRAERDEVTGEAKVALRKAKGQ